MSTIKDYVVGMGVAAADLRDSDEYFEVVQTLVVGGPGNPVYENAKLIDPGNAMQPTDVIEIRRRVGALGDVPYGGAVATDTPALYLSDQVVFNGVQDKVAHTLTLGSSFSLEAWVTCTGPGSVGGTIYGTIFGLNPGRRLLFGTDGTRRLIRAEMLSGGFSTQPGTAALNTKLHVVYTYNNAVERIYINGSAAATRTIALGVSPPPTWNGTFWEGSYSATSVNYSLKGILERRAFYAHELPAARVLAHYQAGK